MKLYSKEGEPLIGLSKGQKVSLLTNGQVLEVKSLESQKICVRFYSVEFQWDMDDEESEVTLTGFVKTPYAHGQFVKISLRLGGEE
jgi:hypothetical protein